MQAIGAIAKARRIARVLSNPSPVLLRSVQQPSLSQDDEFAIENASGLSCPVPHLRRLHSTAFIPGRVHGTLSEIDSSCRKLTLRFPSSSMIMPIRLISSDATVTGADSSDTETVKELYNKMLNSVVEKRTAPPNAWLWSFIGKCSSQEDIKLLFDILQRLRIFRLSNLRIPDGFNSALCREVTKSCVRTGAIEFGKKALWKNNLFGLVPDIGSAHHLLLHAKLNNDVKLMVEVMKLVKKNELPLQPGTADLVFSICSTADRWDLMSKYGKRFVKSGVSLRQTSFDLWMEFAARKGDAESLWKIEKWRSESMKQHSLSTGFSCAKGFLLDQKPKSAAAVLQVLNQTLSDSRRPNFVVELKKLATEWPLEVAKHPKKENQEAFVAALQSDISAMVNVLQSSGVEAAITM